MLIKVKQEQIHTDKDKLKIMGNNNNSILSNSSRLPLTDNNNMASSNMQLLTNKVMPHRAMLLMEIHMVNNNNNTTRTDNNKWEVQARYHTREKSKCHITGQLLNHNLMVQLDKRTHLRK